LLGERINVRLEDSVIDEEFDRFSVTVGANDCEREAEEEEINVFVLELLLHTLEEKLGVTVLTFETDNDRVAV
jgi:hypothetical protein